MLLPETSRAAHGVETVVDLLEGRARDSLEIVVTRAFEETASVVEVIGPGFGADGPVVALQEFRPFVARAAGRAAGTDFAAQPISRLRNSSK